MRAALPDEPVLQAIRDGFPALSRQLQLGARFLIDHPDEVALFSMRDLARRAGVQPVTLVRLSRSLGFRNWLGLRQKFVERIRGEPSPYSRRAADLVQRDDAGALFYETFAALRENLQATESGAAEAIRAAATALDRADSVFVAGFRSCFAPAFSFHYAYRLFRPRNVILLSGAAGGFEAELRGVSRRDAVLVVGFKPYSREAAVVAEAARDAEATLIAVTDSAVSPLALKADHVLLFSTDTPSFFPSVVAASALLESLIAMLLARAGKSAVAGVRAAEAQLFASGAYLAPVKGRRP